MKTSAPFILRSDRKPAGKLTSLSNIALFGLLASALTLGACSSGGGTSDRDLSIPGLSGSSKNAGQATTVNRYLWAASLETVNFLPISSADPISGLILTDWYINPEATQERFKVNVYILDSALRADAIKVTVFRQVRDAGTASWIDANVNPATPREMENAILTRARQLRLNSLDN